ncbi:MAG: hypothetical protein GY826_31510 [Fuerstiella sp.]|nr:hypothetical protein [Fuerstiella sp.]
MRTLVYLLSALVFLLGIAWALLFFVVPKTLPAAIDRVLPLVNQSLRDSGLEVSDWTAGRIKLNPTLTRLQIDDLGIKFDLQPTDRSRLQSQGRARRVTLSLEEPGALRASVSAQGIVATIDPADQPPSLPKDRISNGTLVIGQLPLLDPAAAVSEVQAGLQRLLVDNQFSGQFKFDADVILRIDGAQMPARLYTERRNNLFRLRFQRDDIVRLSQKMKLDLSPQQIDLVSLYPLRLVDLVRITGQARAISARRFRHDRWKQDALRHVSWSYLLTQRFGPDFAAQVTSAYETRPGNESDERLMDYHNNAVGRLLQAEGLALKDLPEAVRSDQRVIQHPSSVQHWPKLLR